MHINVTPIATNESAAKSRWRHARNVLCIRLDNMGDLLMTTPALRALRESLPGRRITLFTSESGAEVANYIPEVDDVIPYQAPWMKSAAKRDSFSDNAMIAMLEKGKFDAAVIFTVYSQSPLPAALFCHLAGIPLRLAHCRENPYQLLTDWIPDQEPAEHVRHEVRRQLDLVGAVGCKTNNEHLSFSVADVDATWAHDYLHKANIDISKPWAIVHPGATAPSRRYPPEQWARAVEKLSSAINCPIVFTGSTEERSLIEGIRSSLRTETHSLAGDLTLGRLGAIISLSPLLLCGNTGPAHLAAALGTPVVDLYALTNPQHTPWQVSSRVLFHDVSCRFCYKSICPQGHHQCLKEISPEEVVAAALSLLREDENKKYDQLAAREAIVDRLPI